jgi:hypothetical protein
MQAWLLPGLGSRAARQRGRRGAVALIFATMAVPIVGFTGLAVDYGLWSQTYTALDLAANTAALNAARIAAAAYLANDTNYAAEGQTAGTQWFNAALNQQSYSATSGTITPNVTVALGSASMVVTVTFSGSLKSIFGNLFQVTSYTVGGQAVASIPVAPYTEVVLFLDNSSSMDIAASVSGINQLMTLSACDPSNAFYDPNGTTTNQANWTNQTLNTYGIYQLSYGGQTFSGNTAAGVTLSPVVNDPAPTTPFPAATANEYPTGTMTVTNGSSSFSFGAPFVSTSYATGQTCQGVLPKQSDGTYPIPGPPCAFACHWTNSASGDARGGTADLWGLARRNNIQLRFDLLKNATNTVLAQMASDNLSSINNLSVGVYTFNSTVTQIYPENCTPQAPGCEAGSNFSMAQADVGSPPTYPSVTDTGIQPTVGARTGDNDDTAFPEDMNTLASNYVTAAGDGTSSIKSKKVLMIVTDGFQDDPYQAQGSSSERRAFDPSYCTQFKNMGYTVYVVYTPYYPVVHIAYLMNNWAALVQGTGSTSISYNLQQCASSANDYIAATDQATLNAALLTFLKDALNQPARFTK